MISAEERYPKKRIDIDGLRMAYVETGEGSPIVFLHGNPTSSYLWRNVIPHVAPKGRCIAPDLIGMGDSDKLPDSGPDRYTYVEHRDYLDAFFQSLGLEEDVVLVVHDWGSALGFDWACRHPGAVRGIAYMEPVAKPFSFSGLAEEYAGPFAAMRSEAGEQMVIEENFFIEKLLPGLVKRGLTEEELDVYRRPYLDGGEARRPMLTWPRQIPFDGEPADVDAIVSGYGSWLRSSAVPKLFIHTDPGVIMNWGGTREFCRSFPNQTEVSVEGLHYVQEDCPDEIGSAISRWLDTL